MQMRNTVGVLVLSLAFLSQPTQAVGGDRKDPAGDQPASPTLMAAAPSWLQDSGDTALLKLLRDKGLLTPEEYDSLLQRAHQAQNAREASEKKLDDALGRIEQTKAAPAKEEPKINISHKDGGGFTFETDDKRFATTLSGYAQIRSQYTAFDDTGKHDEWRFEVKRIRIKLDGYVFEDWFKYRVMIDPVGRSVVDTVTTTKDNAGNVTEVKTTTAKVTALKDGYFDIVPYSELGAKVGQFKVPLSRQELIGDESQELPERSIASDEFSYKRDIGLNVHGGFSQRLYYDLGVYNGNGENRPANPDGTDMAYNGRLGLVLAGNDPRYLLETSGDLKRSGDFQAAVETAYLMDLGITSDIGTYELSGLMKYMGFAAEAAYFGRKRDLKNGPDLDDSGYYVQASYMLTDHLEGVGRRSGFNREAGEEDAENTLGLGYYFYGHNLKLQLAYSQLDKKPDGGSHSADDRTILELTARF